MSSKKTANPTIHKAKLIEVYRQAIEQGMPLDHLDEKVTKYYQQSVASKNVESKNDQERNKKWQQQIPLAIRIFSIVVPIGFLTLGLVFIASATVPIIMQLITSAPALQASNLDSPIPKEQVLDVVPLVVSTHGDVAAAIDEVIQPKILDIELDYTNLKNWFEEPDVSLEQANYSSEYMIEIPALNIEGAKVYIGGTNLNKSLIQYPGTALPGGVGSPVIFGHSVLRQFYNPSPKNPNRYNSIFSTIMTLKNGDKIYLTHEGIEYQYVVLDKTEVKPEDTYILAQRNDAKLLKLVTCTPEGTYLRRGVVTAQLVE